ncbi:MAG: glycogen debranching protein [Anaerolineales bacterium]|nr:glycogen debranching protein [Anaerolineales bacterium]
MRYRKSLHITLIAAFIVFLLVSCKRADEVSPEISTYPEYGQIEILLDSEAPANLLTRSTTNDLARKRYAAAGTRAYVIGDLSGGFPPMGWHIKGEMGGVWTHPIKLIDGYWFALNGEWLPPANRFTSGMGYVQMHYPAFEGLELTRTEFAPDGFPVVLTGLTLVNPNSVPRTIELTMDVHSDIMASYPWDWSRPLNAEEFNEKDEGIYDKDRGCLVFQEPGKPWYALVGTSGEITGGDTGSKYWGPVKRSTQRAHSQHGEGMGGQLTLEVNIPAEGFRTLWFAVAGSHTSVEEAEAALNAGLADPEGMLWEKINSRMAVLERSQVDLPDEVLQAAFDWSKLNLADLRFTVTDVQIRDTDGGNDYPAALVELPVLNGVAAGLPDYAEFFGTDGAYSVYALVASGLWDTAMDHLRTIREASRAINEDTGKVVHEVMSDGSVYFGSTNHPGNTNETAQFAIAVELVWRWSGDNAFRDEMYDFVRDGLRYVMTDLDANEDGCPEGFGMIERHGMAHQKLDVSMYTWQALIGLHHMASSKADEETATWAMNAANTLRQNLEKWWMPDKNLYADSIDNCLESTGQRQQLHWINATPMEVAIAPPERATAVFSVLESDGFSGEAGLYHTGEGGGPDGRGEAKVWTLPNSVMAVAEANYGRLDEDQALYYMRAIGENLDLEMPGALPEILPSPDYDPFVDMQERAMFMQAWSSYGIQWPIIHHFLGVRPNIPGDSLLVVPNIPSSWTNLSVKNLRVGHGTIDVSAEHNDLTYRTTISAPAGWTLIIGHTIPTDSEVESVMLDDAETEYEIVDSIGGRTIQVKTTTGTEHTLVVSVKP